MGQLTVSGNEITDTSRALGVQGDGRSADSSYGIWAAATNLCSNGGFETNDTGWIVFNAATKTRSALAAKFGASGLVVTSAGVDSGVSFAVTVSATTAYTYSAWVYSVAGGTYYVQLSDGIDQALAGSFTVLPAGVWTRLTGTGTTDSHTSRSIYVLARQAGDFYVDGVQLETGTFATPYIHTNGATASRAAARVQAPATVVNSTQSWVAMRVRLDTSVSTTGTRMLFKYSDTDNDRIQVYQFSDSTVKLLRAASGVVSSQPSVSVAAKVPGDTATVIGAWTATELKLSVDGAAFSTVADSHIPTIAATSFDIGRETVSSASWLNGDVLWFATGTGVLSDADAVTINAFGNTDSADLPGGQTMIWTADTSAYARTPVDFWIGLATTSAPATLLADTDFTDISSHLASYSVRRGRQFDLDTIEAGTADILFRNTDGSLDPVNTSGAYYPNLIPLRRIRISRQELGVTNYIYDGVIERYEPEYVVSRNSVRTGYQDVRIGCTDAFRLLRRMLIRSGQMTWVDGADNLTFTAREYGPSTITISLVCPGALTGTTTVTVTDKAIVVNMKTNGANAPLATRNDVKAAIEASTDANALISVSVPASGTTVIAAAITPAGGGGEFSQVLSGTRIGDTLTSVGWPVGARSVDAGLYRVAAEGFGPIDNKTDALTHMQDVATSELGYVYMGTSGNLVYHDGDHRSTSTRSTISQITFTDEGAGVPYTSLSTSLDADKVANDVTITASGEGAVEQNAVDGTSQTSYGPAIVSKTTKLVNSADALAVANNILNAYKTPTPRITQLETVDVGTSAWAAVLGLDIGDRITVRSNPPGHLTTLAYDCFVEQIQHDVVFDRPHRVTLQLTQISASISSGGSGGGGSGDAVHDSSGDDFTLDDASLGVLG